MSTELATPVLLPNGYILSQAEYTDEGGVRDVIHSPFSSDHFSFAPSFSFKALGLTPDTDYKVEIVDCFVEKFGQDDINYPNAWTDRLATIGTEETFTTDAQGDLIGTYAPSFTNNYFLITRSDVFVKALGAPIGDYIVGEFFQPHIPDPNDLLKIEMDKVSTEPFQVEYNDEIYEVLGIERTARYQLELKTVGNSELKIVFVTVDYLLVTDLNTQSSSSFLPVMPAGTITVPIDFGGATYQTYSPFKDTPLPAEGDPYFQDKDSQIIPTVGIFCVESLNT